MLKFFIKKQKISGLIIAAFLLAVTLAQIAYVQSTFLNQFFNLEIVSIIFFIAYLITFIVMNEYPKLIAKFNNLNTALVIFILEIFSLLTFIFIQQQIPIFIAFIVYILCTNLIFINFDIFLEAYTKDSQTGRIRGIYYTVYNLGWVISPFISGEILKNFNFNILFGLVITLILPIMLILLFKFKKFKNHYARKHFKLTHMIKELVKHPNIEKIFYLAFLLQFFYGVMVIYTPIYLNQTIGLPWDEIGIIFTIMLIPFVIIEFPAGYLADKYWGEKELLTTGLLITIAACLSIFIFNNSSFWFWAAVLFFSRIGASLIEIMRDTYFFKKINAKDLELINAFRSTMPLAYIFVPLVSAIVLYFLPINYIFLVLAGILFSGLYFALSLKDTK